MNQHFRYQVFEVLRLYDLCKAQYRILRSGLVEVNYSL